MAFDDRVTVIGGGPMGVALTRALLRGGCAVTVWNRTPSRLDDVVDEGAARATSLPSALRASPLVLISLATYHVTRQLFSGPEVETAIDGRSIVQLSSGTSRQAREFGEWVGSHGATYLDGMPMVYSRQIGEPSARIMISGPAKAFERHGDTLSIAAPALQFVSEDLASVNHVSLPLWAFYYGAYGAFLEAASYASQVDVDIGEFVPLVEPMLEALRSSMRDGADRLQARRFDGKDSSVVAVTRDLEGLVALFQRKGVPALAVASLIEYLSRANTAGDGPADPIKTIDHILHPQANEATVQLEHGD